MQYYEFLILESKK